MMSGHKKSCRPAQCRSAGPLRNLEGELRHSRRTDKRPGRARSPGLFALGFAVLSGLAACGEPPSATPTPSHQVEIETSPRKIYPGGTSLLVAHVSTSVSSEELSYFWSATHEGLAQTESEDTALFIAAPAMAPDTVVGITVSVSDVEGGLLAESSADVTILAPSSHPYLFDLDASERTGQSIDETTWLDSAKQAVMEELDSWILEGQSLGLRVFGYTEEPSDYCENTQLLVEIVPQSGETIRQKLAEVQPQREAPLREAIVAGLNDLMPECGESCRLIVITHGPDDCTGENLDTIKTRISDKVQGSANVEIYELALATTERGVEALLLLRDHLRDVVPATFVLQADDASSLKRILDHLALLGASDPLLQSLGYKGLSDILQAQGDDAGFERLFGRSLEISSAQPGESIYQRGLAWGGLRVWPGAYLDFTALALGDTADLETVHFLRGVASYNLGQYQEAVDDFSNATAIDPSFALAEYARGLSLARLGAFGSSEAFSDAFALQPDLLSNRYFETLPTQYRVPTFYAEAERQDLWVVGDWFFRDPAFFLNPEFLVSP